MTVTPHVNYGQLLKIRRGSKMSACEQMVAKQVAWALGPCYLYAWFQIRHFARARGRCYKNSQDNSFAIGRVSVLQLIVVVTLSCAGCGRVADTATLERLQAAESEFAAATESAHFASAAQTYQQVTESGFVSGPALYNQANAYRKSDQLGRAIAAYREALRYLPRDPKLVANLESALGKSLDESNDTTLLDYIFIWQRWLSYRETFQLTSFWLVVTLALHWSSRWHWHSFVLRRAAFLTGGLCLLFAASSVLDWHRYEQQQRGVLVEQVTPRKGNSDNYDPAFTKSLSEGTEFVVRERRRDWLRANFGDNAEGWVPVDSSVVY